ncbi:MAG: hypothetical protein ABEJ04_05370 [Halobacteriaceae archaeon]
MSQLVEVVPEVVVAAGYGAASVLLTALGAVAEYGGYEKFTLGGDTTVALWMTLFGLLVLYAGLVLFGGEALRRTRTLVAE